MNVALVAPAATVTLDGTVAAAVLLLESPIVAPPTGAAPLSVTVPVEDCVPPTLVLTVNVALVAPAATVTLDGTVAAAVLLLESATVAPPAGAGPLNVTAPVEGVPPMTLVGFSVSDERVGGGGGADVTVSEADRVAPL